ncbi:DNA-directed RNA polymerase I subunit RPA2-like, partial [Ruditapes philippinarum]|uniref:DNA-directed RNA polymerase I subunit RPA2-like n=1 Tax=Ruditapes philippinarum TaxID=129788 RepID=UPI00295AD7A5
MENLPNFKNLTASDYGRPKETQNQNLQDLVRPHIESFNCILHEGLGKIIENSLPVEFSLPNGDRVALSLQDIIIGSPKVHEKAICRTAKVYPAECRSRGTSYKGPLQVQIGYTVNGQAGPPIPKVLGQLPIMVKSEMCHLSKMSPKELIKHGEEAEEMGGYFIVNGIERLVRMIILPRRNYPICLTRPGWRKRGTMFSDYGVMMRCVRSDHTATNMVLHYLNDGTAKLCFFYNQELFFAPIVVILKGLMSLPDKYIYDELVKGKEDDSFYKGCVVAMLRQALNENLLTKQSVLKHIGSRFRVKLSLPEWKTDEEVGQFLLQQCVCVHLTNDVDKFNLLVYMTRKLFDFAKGKCAAENGDSPMFQEVLLGGHLFQMYLKEKLDGYLQIIKSVIDRQAKAYKGGSERYRLTPDALINALRYGPDICKSFEYLVATGNLVTKSGLALMQNSGLTVVADKLNFMRYISHFRCIHRGAFFATMRTTAVRKLLPEAWGFLCPVHTPDGSPCGLMNHATAMCQFQVFTFHEPIIKALDIVGVASLDNPPCPIGECYTVMLDGRIVGYVSENMAPQVEQKLRVMKVKGLHKVPPTMEICLVKKTEYASQYPGLYLFTTPARMVRPVRNLALNEIEMIGTFEQVYMDICITQKEAYEGVTTHEELDGVSMLSVAANLTPFSDFNQSPRNMYQCQMGKQTMGVPLHALKFRSDNKLYKIQTPQTPMVRPTKYDYYDMDSYPLGTNAVVAVISYTGYDMEDAMVINKAAFQRGFGHATVYKTEIINLGDLIKSGFDTTPLIFSSSETSKAYLAGEVDLDGLPYIGRCIKPNTVYYSYINTQSGAEKVNYYKSQEPAYVEHIKLLGNDTGTSGKSKVAIMLRIDRNPIIGDKFASRHGQKGVCSMMYPVENLPFTESGMTPDIIFNPHGYPSRMTIGMMIESMAGKSAASYGHCYDATPFQFSEDDPAIDHFGNMLVKAGYNYHGTERFYSGIDGRELEASIFMGVVYYQRLRHMVSDKFQVRTT